MNDRRRLVLRSLAVAAIATTSLAGCGSHTSPAIRRSPSSTRPAPTTGRATIGALTISGAYIPQPASPDVAAAYLTITNNGATADTITKITTSVTASVMAMTEAEDNGVGSMSAMSAVTIPAYGHIALTPGHAHLMLENPKPRLRAGQHVNITLTFAHAGTITLALPIKPI